MKTLNDQINDVLKSQKSASEKRSELVKLGLRDIDVSILFKINADLVGTHRREAHDTLARIISRYTFGVEIECYNAPRTDLANALASNHLSVNNVTEYRNAHTGSYRNAYRLVPDGSIYGVNPVECVTPILRGSSRGFNSLQSCCNALNAIGAKVNKSTGLHIHVGGEITEAQYINTFVNYYYLESVIDTFMAASRRDNPYAKSCHDTTHGTKVNAAQLLNAQSVADVYDAFHGDRYYKINVCSWHRHSTIEFRQHSGSTNYEKIRMWALFCLKLTAWSADNRLTADITTIDAIPFLTAAEKRFFKQRATELAGADE